MHSRVLALAAFVVLALLPAVASAQPATTAPPDWSITLAAKVWVTSANSNWSVKSAGVDPLTELRWRGVNAVLPEVSVDLVWKRLIWQLSTGGNTLGEGSLVDESFASSNHQGRFSMTRSPVDSGYVVYVNNDIGGRVLDWWQPLIGKGPVPLPARGYLDVFLGYQFWRENYGAFGAQGSLFLPGGLVIDQAEPRNVKFVTNQYTRHSVRIGARTQIPIVAGLSVKALVAISPYTHTDYEDTHHLTTGLRQPTNSSANGGFGVQAEGGLAYAVWSGLSVEAGFRYWRFDSGGGEVVTTTTSGSVSRDKVNEMITERYGPYAGLSWRF